MSFTPSFKLWKADRGIVVDGNGNFIARTYSSVDACLIAAAPDLLNACRELVAEFDQRNAEIMEQPGYGPIPDSSGIVLARIAIKQSENL